MFTAKADLDQQVGPIHGGDKARLERNAVGIFDTGCQTEDLDVISADLATKVGEIG
jgi:hypothetical protein